MPGTDTIAPINADTAGENSTTLSITVSFPGGDGQQFEDRRLLPGTTCLDLLRDLGLSGYALRKPGDGGGFFAAHDDVYAAMSRANTSKLDAVPGMQVAQAEAPSGASGRWSRLVGRLRPTGPPPVVGPSSAPAIARPPQRRAPLVRRRLAAAVMRRPVSLWERQGWRQLDERTWRGRYRLPQGVWEGEIERTGERCYRPWIFSPPPVVRSHPHAACLFFKGPGRHMLHFSRDPIGVDAALMAMEGFLAESYVASQGRARA